MPGHPAHGLETPLFDLWLNLKSSFHQAFLHRVNTVFLPLFFWLLPSPSCLSVYSQCCLFSLFSSCLWTFFKAALCIHNAPFAMKSLSPLWTLSLVRLEFIWATKYNGVPKFFSYLLTTMYLAFLHKPKIVHHLEFYRNVFIFTICGFKIFLS